MTSVWSRPLLIGMELRPQREMTYLRSPGQLVPRQDEDPVSRILMSFSPVHILYLLCFWFIHNL